MFAMREGDRVRASVKLEEHQRNEILDGAG